MQLSYITYDADNLVSTFHTDKRPKDKLERAIWDMFKVHKSITEITYSQGVGSSNLCEVKRIK